VVGGFVLAGLFGCAQPASQQVTTQPGAAPTNVEVRSEQGPSPVVSVPDGWVQYGGLSAVTGVEVPVSAWLRDVDRRPGMQEPGALAEDGTFEVFDRPDGSLIGYYFAELGYAPKDLVDSGAYDPVAAIKANYGCDVMRDRQCKIQQNEKNLAATPAPG